MSRSWATPRGSGAGKPKRSGDIIARYDERQHALNTITSKGGLTPDQYRQLLLGRNRNSNSRPGAAGVAVSAASSAACGGGGGGLGSGVHSRSQPQLTRHGAGEGGAVAAITRRLQVLEASHAEATVSLREARAKNDLLRQTVTDLKAVLAERDGAGRGGSGSGGGDGAGSGAAGGGGEQVAGVVVSLRQENDRLKRKVAEMEAFLKSSGLKWTGYKDRSVEVFSGAGQSLRSHAGFNVDDLLRQFKQLNIAAQKAASAEAQGYERRSDGSYRLRQDAKPLPLTIYKDGLFLLRGPLRPYSHPKTVAFLTDIANGHFPYEFKQRYPHGVVMEVTDKRGTLSTDDRSGAAAATNAMPTAEFLRQVPERKVLPSGDIIHMRQEMRHALTGTTPGGGAGTGTGSATRGGAGSGRKAGTAGDVRGLRSRGVGTGANSSGRNHRPSSSSGRWGGGGGGGGGSSSSHTGAGAIGGASAPSPAAAVAAAAATPGAVLRGSPKRSLQSPKPAGSQKLDLALSRGKPRSPRTASGPVAQHAGSSNSTEGARAATLGGEDPSPAAGERDRDRHGAPCKLLVSLPGGVDKLMLAMRATNTVADLRARIRVERSLAYNFEIRTAFPPRTYGDLTKTLAEEKLVPSAKVMVLRVS